MRKLRIDIVSDVVCPWCIIGYKNLQRALDEVSHLVVADIYWHPFELNPAMPEGGENLREHLEQKYHITRQQSDENRQRLIKLGKEVGFDFHFTDDTRIYNTRKAHQLLMWSQQQGKQYPLKMALFHAYFTEGKAVDNEDVLLDIAVSVGLNREDCQAVLEDESWAQTVAATEQQWLEAGIQAVPAFIINRKEVISGAQSSAVLVNELLEVADVPPHTH